MPPTILCVDDDRHFCDILNRAFCAEGYAVHTAHDGEEAVTRARDLVPDLVFLDVVMPRRDGFAALEDIRGLRGPAAQVPVVLLSGCSPTPAWRQRASGLGVAGFLTKPVPLDRLLAMAAKSLGRAERVDAATAPPQEGSSLSGSLQDVPFPALLHQLHGLRASGVVELGSGRKRKRVELRDGHPVGVQSNLVGECLGNLLAASGKISLDVMHESLRRAQAGEGLQGQILVAMHMLDEEDLSAALRHQAEEKLFELFSWETGRFRFVAGARLARANRLPLKGSPANLILEGVRTRFPLARVDAFLAENARLRPGPGSKPFYRFQDVEVDPTEQALMQRLDGSERLGDLLPLDERARRTLYAWIVSEIVELRSGPGEEGLPAGRAATAETARGAVEETLREELAELAGRLRGRDCFEVLGVPRRTTDEAVRAAWVELAKRTHPDRYRESSDAVRQLAEEAFRIVSEAYETIASSERRLEYLRALRNRDHEAAELEEGQRALRAELEFQKGGGCLQRKDYPAAVQHFERAMRTYPEEGEYQAHFGWAFYLAGPDEPGRVREAIEHVLAGRKLAPDREKPYLFLGWLYKASGRVQIAERMFHRALQLDPDCVEAIRELRLIDMRRQRSRGLVRRILRR